MMCMLLSCKVLLLLNNIVMLLAGRSDAVPAVPAVQLGDSTVRSWLLMSSVTACYLCAKAVLSLTLPSIDADIRNAPQLWYATRIHIIVVALHS